MAYTQVEKINLGQGNGQTNGVFYNEDIAVVLNQIGEGGVQANATKIFDGVNFDGTKQFKAQVAVVMNTLTGEIIETFTKPYHWVAIACPPYNKSGYEANP